MHELLPVPALELEHAVVPVDGDAAHGQAVPERSELVGHRDLDTTGGLRRPERPSSALGLAAH